MSRYVGRSRLLHTDKDPRRPWMEHDPLRDPFAFAACHWGQLKLLYSEIEFLTLAAAVHDLSTCTVVYVGAAPGHSISLLRRLFPTVRFLLIDPAPFFAKQDSHVRILNTMCTDETVAAIVAGKDSTRTLLFLSDIRLTVDDRGEFEDAVFLDLLSQQRWCMAMGAGMAMLKFRLPFADAATGGPRDMRYDYRSKLVSLKKGVPKDPTEVPRGSMVYLDGEVRLQLYPPPDSAETRLIVRRTSAGKYPLRSYDYKAYEETMSHFNTVTRRARYTFPHAALLARNVAGFDAGSYEGASEAWIASEYVRVVTPVPGPGDLQQAVARLVFALHRDMWEATNKSVVSCKLDTPLASAKQHGIRRVVERLLRVRGRRSLQASLDEAAQSTIERAEVQIASFVALAAGPAKEQLVLNRIDYLAQASWLRSEVEEIRRLHSVYSGILNQKSSQ